MNPLNVGNKISVGRYSPQFRRRKGEDASPPTPGQSQRLPAGVTKEIVDIGGGCTKEVYRTSDGRPWFPPVTPGEPAPPVAAALVAPPTPISEPLVEATPLPGGYDIFNPRETGALPCAAQHYVPVFQAPTCCEPVNLDVQARQIVAESDVPGAPSAHLSIGGSGFIPVTQ